VNTRPSNNSESTEVRGLRRADRHTALRRFSEDERAMPFARDHGQKMSPLLNGE